MTLKFVTSDTPEITTKTAPFDVSMELSSIKAFGVANSLSLLENDTLIIGADDLSSFAMMNHGNI